MILNFRYFKENFNILNSSLNNFIIFSNSSFSFSNPGLPNKANMFFLYASTPGWSNGLTPNIYPLNAQAFSKKYTKYPKLYSSNFGILTIKFGTLPSVCANKFLGMPSY